MNKFFILFFISFIFFINSSMSEEELELKNPFEDVLPKDKDLIIDSPHSGEEEVFPPDIYVEGVLWGTDKPCAIINGKVYKKGDYILSREIQLLDIDKNIVFIWYKGKIFKFGVKKGGG